MAIRKIFLSGVAIIGLASVPAVANTNPGLIVGALNGQPFQATNRIVGTTSTATAAGGGNPIYFPQFPRDSGVASLIIQRGSSASICSGTLAGNGRSIVTAAHCVSNGFDLSPPDSITAYFYGGTSVDAVTFLSPESVAISVSRISVNPGYTGQTIDQNDIAVLGLATAAPDFARIYTLSNITDLTDRSFTQYGYGDRTLEGGSAGANLGAGRLRQGDNSYDVRLGDPAFGGFFTTPGASGFGFFDNPAGPRAAVDFTFLADFDNGNPANDASCIALGFCGLGLGVRESNTAGGDSGGPQFINGRLASVTSFGLTFGTRFGDVDNDLNSSFGEFAGYVPVSIHRNFIQSAFLAVPEPSTWAMMIFGFGAVGGMMRRQRKTGKITFGVTGLRNV
jgi:hypothetical protein